LKNSAPHEPLMQKLFVVHSWSGVHVPPAATSAWQVPCASQNDPVAQRPRVVAHAVPGLGRAMHVFACAPSAISPQRLPERQPFVGAAVPHCEPVPTHETVAHVLFAVQVRFWKMLQGAPVSPSDAQVAPTWVPGAVHVPSMPWAPMHSFTPRQIPVSALPQG
jgi:hypothetical protein